MTYVVRTGPYVPNIGNFDTLAELLATHPATLYNPGTTAYTADQGIVVSSGTAWEDVGTGGSFALTAATYAAARAISGVTTGDRLEVLGRTSQSDGGQGLFTWVAGGSTTIDDGIELAATGGIWRRADISPAPNGVAIRLEAFGGAVGGFYDAALAKAITALGVTGGGTLVFGPKTYAFANQWPAIPVNGANVAVPIMLQGSGPTFNGHWNTGLNGGTILDLQFAAGTSGKILLTGIGYFGGRGVTFYDSTHAGGALIYTTNTTIDFDYCAFVGFNCFPQNNLPADQDAIICGGTTTTVSGTSPTAAFQGYGSIVRNCYFGGIRRGLYGRVYANAIRFIGNTIAATCGTRKSGVSTDTTPFITFDSQAQSSSAAGNIVVDNLFECNYIAYCVLLNLAANNIIGPNGFYDAIGNTIAMVQLGLPLGTFTGTATAASPTITGVTAPSLTAGMYVSGTGIASGTFVNSFIGTTVTLNQNAQVSGSLTFSFSYATQNNTIISGLNSTAVGLIEDNTNGAFNTIHDQFGSAKYSRFPTLTAYPQGGPAMATAQFGSPEGGNTPIVITPDFPANAGLPNNTARAGQITNGTPMLKVVQAAADGGATSFQVNYDGGVTLGSSAIAAQFTTNGQKWVCQGTGAQMTWDSGSGGSYGVLKHFGIKRSKYNGGGFVQNAQNSADASDVWSTNNYVTKNYIEVYTPITVAQLPAGVAGMRYMVSDATAPTFGATVVGGGAVQVPVYFDTTWKVG